jgi:hypothetical protein
MIIGRQLVLHSLAFLFASRPIHLAFSPSSRSFFSRLELLARLWLNILSVFLVWPCLASSFWRWRALSGLFGEGPFSLAASFQFSVGIFGFYLFVFAHIRPEIFEDQLGNVGKNKRTRPFQFASGGKCKGA